MNHPRWTKDDANVHRTEPPETRWERIRAEVRKGVLGGKQDGEITAMQYKRLAFWNYLRKRGKNDGSHN